MARFAPHALDALLALRLRRRAIAAPQRCEITVQLGGGQLADALFGESVGAEDDDGKPEVGELPLQLKRFFLSASRFSASTS